MIGVFRNLLERPVDPIVFQIHRTSMVNCRVLRQMFLFEEQNFEDAELQSDIQFIVEKLEQAMQDMSSFMEYAIEVRSGQ